MPLIDTSTEFGQRVERRLAEERIIWLTTVRHDGTPQPSPVWFLREGDSVLIYSQPDTPKIRNIEGNPKVALTFNTDPTGNDVVVLAGEARTDTSAPAAKEHEAFLDRYRDGIRSLGMTPEEFAQSFSMPIRVTLARLRGF